MHTLDHTRLSSAAGSVGLSQACIDASVKYANERIQFGKRIGEFQMVQERIADMVVETEAARLLTYRCAQMKDQGIPNTLETSIAKLYAAHCSAHTASLAMEIHGAYGFSDEYPVERYFRDAELNRIAEGSSNIQRILIAMDALGWKKANRPVRTRINQ